MMYRNFKNKIISVVVLAFLTLANLSVASGLVEYDSAQGFIMHSLLDDTQSSINLLTDSLSSSNQGLTAFSGESAVNLNIDENNNNSDESVRVNSSAGNLLTADSISKSLTFTKNIIVSENYLRFPNNLEISLDSSRVFFQNTNSLVVASIVKDLHISQNITDRSNVAANGIFSKGNFWVDGDSSVGVAPSVSYKLNVSGSINTDTSVCISGACWNSLPLLTIFDDKAKYSVTSPLFLDTILYFGNTGEVLSSTYRYADISPLQHTHTTNDITSAIIVNADIASSAGIDRSKISTCSKLPASVYQITSLIDRNPNNCPAGTDGRRLNADTEGGVDACLTFNVVDLCGN